MITKSIGQAVSCRQRRGTPWRMNAARSRASQQVGRSEHRGVVMSAGEMRDINVKRSVNARASLPVALAASA